MPCLNLTSDNKNNINNMKNKTEENFIPGIYFYLVRFFRGAFRGLLVSGARIAFKNLCIVEHNMGAN